MRHRTTSLMQRWSNSDVSTVPCIPDVDEVVFFTSETTRMGACMSGQCSRDATSTARDLVPSAFFPLLSCDVAAEERAAKGARALAGDEREGREVGWELVEGAREATSAGKPAADEARPAVVLILHRKPIWARQRSWRSPGKALCGGRSERGTATLRRGAWSASPRASACRVRVRLQCLSRRHSPPVFFSTRPSSPFCYAIQGGVVGPTLPTRKLLLRPREGRWRPTPRRSLRKHLRPESSVIRCRLPVPGSPPFILGI